MKRAFFFLLFFVSLSGASCLAAPTTDDIRVKAEVDKAFLTIGDLVTYTVTVEHAPDIKILSDFPAPSLWGTSPPAISISISAGPS